MRYVDRLYVVLVRCVAMSSMACGQHGSRSQVRRRYGARRAARAPQGAWNLHRSALPGQPRIWSVSSTRPWSETVMVAVSPSFIQMSMATVLPSSALTLRTTLTFRAGLIATSMPT